MTYHELLIEILEEKIEEIKQEQILSYEDIEEKVSKLFEEIMSDEFLSKHAKEILNILEPKAPIMYEENRLMMQEFESRLQLRWLDAFYIIQLFLTISTESSIELMDELYSNGEKSTDGSKTFINIFESEMIQLQRQAIILAKEMNLLLKSGFSEAAFSRWRSLFEVSVIMGSMIKLKHKNTKQAQTVAQEFYLSGAIIERAVAEKNHNEDLVKQLTDEIETMGIDPQRLNKLKRDYEWARSFTAKSPKEKIYFSDLIEFSELEHLKQEYKDACQYIHVSSYGLHNPLGEIPINNKIVFGPTNAGLSRPLQLILISLLNCTTSFLTLDYTIDRAIQIKLLEMVINESLELIVEIDRKIIEEENSS